VLWPLDAVQPSCCPATTLALPDEDALAGCADESCRRVFYDGTRSRTRRWRDFGTCSNRARVRRHRNKAARTA
jgi:predicted RNA-binding Zn ribbon-like protein